ncbi:MAG TPA: hypothetical protein VLQ93_04050 [Myxococcaceae bacterium]|nr:hypothetical protein [Myxococcaceae bacterium]
MRHIGTLLLVALVGALARAEGVDSSEKIASTRVRLNGATTVLPVAGGLVSLGGSSLRQLVPGARRWKVLHRQSGDNLYRVAGDDSGRLLAAWEKDPFIHYFTAGPKRQHLRLPKPVVPSPGHRAFSLQSLFFSPNGRDALVSLSGSRAGIDVRWSTAVYRIALDGKSAPELLFLDDGGFLLHISRNGAVFARPRDPRQRCDNGGCAPIAAIIAYDFSGGRVLQRTLLTYEQVPMSIARPVRGSNHERVVVMLGLDRGGRALLRWRPGEATADYRPLPRGSLDAVSMVTRTDEFIELRTHGSRMSAIQLDVKRYPPEGGEQVVTLPPLQKVDTNTYGLGVRKDGSLWVHWGDHLVLLGPDKPARSFSLEPLLVRRTEWAGADIYIETPESLWVGIEAGAGRNFVRVDFAEAEKRAKRCPGGK